jgi:putative ABC transport system permease protein
VFNQSAVRAFGFLSADAIVGQVFGRNSGDTEIEVIGVVPDMPLQSALEDTGPTIFYVAPSDFRHALIRVPGGAIREGIAEIDRIWNEVVPLQPVQREFADERIARLWRTMQIQAGVMTFFCSLAIVIGLLGLLGLAAFNAERRTKEIGVRKALGATTFDIAVLLTRQTLAPVVVANLIGWPLALWATMRFLSGFALHVEIGVGPFALAGLGTVLFTGAVVLLYAVARSRLQPANALRYE